MGHSSRVIYPYSDLVTLDAYDDALNPLLFGDAQGEPAANLRADDRNRGARLGRSHALGERLLGASMRGVAWTGAGAEANKAERQNVDNSQSNLQATSTPRGWTTKRGSPF
jgi:hypothetical protein